MGSMAGDIGAAIPVLSSSTLGAARLIGDTQSHFVCLQTNIFGQVSVGYCLKILVLSVYRECFTRKLSELCGVLSHSVLLLNRTVARSYTPCPTCRISRRSNGWQSTLSCVLVVIKLCWTVTHYPSVQCMAWTLQYSKVNVILLWAAQCTIKHYRYSIHHLIAFIDPMVFYSK